MPDQVEAIYRYDAQQDGDLAFIPGERLVVEEHLSQSWARGYSLKTGKSGVFPTNYVFFVAEYTQKAPANAGGRPLQLPESLKQSDDVTPPANAIEQPKPFDEKSDYYPPSANANQAPVAHGGNASSEKANYAPAPQYARPANQATEQYRPPAQAPAQQFQPPQQYQSQQSQQYPQQFPQQYPQRPQQYPQYSQPYQQPYQQPYPQQYPQYPQQYPQYAPPQYQQYSPQSYPMATQDPVGYLTQQPQQQQQQPQQQQQQQQQQPQQQDQSHHHSHMKDFARRFGDSVVFGAGSSLGADIINKIF